jgi:MFS superfamily sulfate permease-like transporter/CRP-like cAMP-binding protein
MESRILTSPVAETARGFSALPPAWRTDARSNITAGALAAVQSLPLSMGLGALALAPLGPAYAGYGALAGLYAAAFLGLVALLAGARGIALYAPRSLVSFMIGAVVAHSIVGAAWLPKDNPELVLAAVFLVLALAGAFQMSFALLRLAQLVKFIPTPVMAGFQNAAAIVILLSQVPFFVGLSEWPASLAEIQPLTLLVGAVTLGLACYGQRIVKRVPPLITALVGGIVLYYLLRGAGFSQALGPMLGAVPVSIPDGRQLAHIMAITQQPGFLGALPGLVLGAASIALVTSLDALVSAKALENLSGQRDNSTRQLMCIGAANTVTPLLGGIAGSITPGPSTASYESGARNSLSLFVHSSLFLVFVALAAPLLSGIPLVVISALVVHAGLQLVDRWTLQLLRAVLAGKSVAWSSIFVDLFVIGLVMGIALAGEVVLAVGIGVAIAVVVFTMRMSRGVIRSMRYGDEVQSRRERNSAHTALLAKHGRRILAIELEGPLFFASAEALHNCMDTAIAAQVRYLILDMSRVNEVDSTGAHILVQGSERLRSAGIHLLISGQDERPNTAVLLRHHGVVASSPEHSLPDLDRALEWCENHLLASLDAGEQPGDYPFELLDLVSGMSDEDRAALKPTLERREYEPGSVVFSQDELSHALYIILRGTASVRVHDIGGRERRLMTFSPGTVFGEMALLDREARSATVTADTALACYVLNAAAFNVITALRPTVSIRLLANLGRELSYRLRRSNQIVAGER